MLTVKFEIVPFGQEDHEFRRMVGKLEIALQSNFSTPEGDLGHYSSRLITDGVIEPEQKEVRIEHLRKDGAFKLVQKCLEAHHGEA